MLNTYVASYTEGSMWNWIKALETVAITLPRSLTGQGMEVCRAFVSAYEATSSALKLSQPM